MSIAPAEVAKRLYEAFAQGDGQSLFDLLTDDFVGTVSTGMPHGVGGDHYGRGEMIADVWGRIAAMYHMHVDPHEFLPVDETRVVVLGRYQGEARDGSCSVDAAFAHIITTRGDRVAALQQITDTVQWGVPIAS